jgi:hypothetical protein
VVHVIAPDITEGRRSMQITELVGLKRTGKTFFGKRHPLIDFALRGHSNCSTVLVSTETWHMATPKKRCPHILNRRGKGVAWRLVFRLEA